jgi:uncharacterized protein (TIRG00374 family)
MKPWRNLLIGAVISGSFLWLALRDVGWLEVRTLVQDIRWEYIPLILLIWSGGLAARALRWHYLMGEQVAWWNVFHIHNIGFLINGTLPFRLGELVRAYLVARERTLVSGWAALTSILTERILDVLALVIILVLLLPALPLEATFASTGMVVGGVAGLAFVALLVFAHNPARINAIVNKIVRRLPIAERLHPVQLVNWVLDGLTPLTERGGLLRIGFWTAMSWLLALFEVWSLALLFPNWPESAAIYAGLALALVGASLSIVIPFTPAGIGPFEAAVVFALGVGGVPREFGATYAVVWHAGLVLFYALWGIIGLLTLGLSPAEVWRGAGVMGKHKLPEN